MNYCKEHQGDHSHYDPENCAVCRMKKALHGISLGAQNSMTSKESLGFGARQVLRNLFPEKRTELEILRDELKRHRKAISRVSVVEGVEGLDGGRYYLDGNVYRTEAEAVDAFVRLYGDRK